MLKKCLIFWAVFIYLNLFKWCCLNVTQPSLINNHERLQLVVSLWQHIQDLTSDWPSPRTFSKREVLFKPSPKHLQIPRWSVQTQTQPKWLPSDVRKPVMMFRNNSKDSTINCCCTSITVYSEVFGLRVRQPRSPATKQRPLCLTEITNCPYG